MTTSDRAPTKLHTLTVGKATITVYDDDLFFNGFQSGMLDCQVDYQHPISDVELQILIESRMLDISNEKRYNVGFIVGFLDTLMGHDFQVTAKASRPN